MKKKVCILVFADIAHDMRVQREVEAACKDYAVDVIAYGKWVAPAGVRFFSLPQTSMKASPLSAVLLLTGAISASAWEHHYWRREEYGLAVKLIKEGQYDLIHANDLSALPVAATGAKDSKTCILFDAHEFYFEQGETPQIVYFRKPYLKYLFRTYSRNVSKIITVSDGIAELYQKQFGWESEIIMNAPFYVEHAFHAVNPDQVNIVNHGRAIRGRRIEDLILMMPRLEKRFHLHLYLKPGDMNYYQSLKAQIDSIAPDRITLHNPIPPDAILDEINKYDLGIHFLDPRNLNHFNALPKKIFEYIMAGLASAITPLPEMRKIVDRWQVGVVASDHSWQSMAKALNSLTAGQIDAFKYNSLELAKTLNANNEMKKLMNIYAAMVGT